MIVSFKYKQKFFLTNTSDNEAVNMIPITIFPFEFLINKMTMILKSHQFHHCQNIPSKFKYTEKNSLRNFTEILRKVWTYGQVGDYLIQI